MAKDGTEAGAIRRAIDSLSAAELHGSSRLKWQLFGEQVLPAWVADMDFPVAPPVERAIQNLIDRHDLGYHLGSPSPGLRDALVSRMAERFSWQIEPKRIVPLANVLQGLDVSVLLHSRRDDGVVVLMPIYPPFLAAVGQSGRRLVEGPLVRGATRFEIDFDRLRAAIDPRVRVLLLCNPHNPTGRVFERAELTALGELALEHDWIVVADEIHADLTYPGHRHLAFATLGPELAERTVTLTSATKAFNFAGLPSGFAIFGSDRVQQLWLDLPRHVLGHCGIVGDGAACAAWTEGQPWLDEVMAYLTENRLLVLDFFARELPDLRILPPEATYLAWLDCCDLDLPGDPFGFFLEHARVALSRGLDFGTGGETCVRLNFATSRAILQEILERMAAAVRGRA